MAEEVKKEAISLTTLALLALLSVGLTVFWDVFTVFLPSIAFCTQNVSNLIPSPSIELMGGPFIMFLVVMGLIRIPSLRKHLSTTNLVYLYVTTLGVSYFANTSHPWGYDVGLVLSRPLSSDTYNQFVPDFVTYPKDIAARFYAGYGSIGAIPWSTVFPDIMWRFLLVALFGGISIGMSNIFRRQWIDVERLPFPHIMLAHACLMNVEDSNKKEWFQRKPFLYGILAGIVLAIPLSGITLFPWFPDILGWRTNTCAFGSQYIAPADLPWLLGLNKHFPVYALLLLVPLHILFSVVFYTFVFQASMFIAYYGFGAYTGFLSMGFCGRNWCGENTPYVSPPLNYFTLITGAMLGLFVITIVLERDYIIETLKLALEGKHSETERLELISYRASWACLVVSYILLMVFFMFTGFSPWVSFVLPLSGIITWFVMSQLWGRLGMFVQPCYHFTPGIIKMFVWPTVASPGPDVNSVDVTLAPVMSREWIGHQSITGWGGSLFTVLGSYRMAQLTNVNPRNVLKVVVATLFVAMLVTEIVQTAAVGVYGAPMTYTNTFKVGPIEGDLGSGSFWPWPAPASIIQNSPWLITGFVFMVVMRYLCTIFLWLPDPIAAIVAWEWIISIEGVWSACLVAWVIKYIVLKVGGSKLYSERVVPFVGGFMLGDALEVLLSALTAYGLMRFSL